MNTCLYLCVFQLKKEEPCDSDGAASEPGEVSYVPPTGDATSQRHHHSSEGNSLLEAATAVSPADLDSFDEEDGAVIRKRRSDEGMQLKDELDFEEGEDGRESGEEGDLGEGGCVLCI